MDCAIREVSLATFMESQSPYSVASTDPTSIAAAGLQLESARQCLFWGWILVGGGCVISLIPFIGLVTWFIGPPLIVVGFVLAIIGIAKGRTAGGICLLLFSIFVAPFALFLGPVIASFLGLAAAAKSVPQPSPDSFLESRMPASLPTP